MTQTVDLTFEGGQVLLPEGGLCVGEISIADGKIADARAGKRVDARGFRFLPGIVDIHGDGFEKHLAPRRGAMTDMVAGMSAAEADLVACGISRRTDGKPATHPRCDGQRAGQPSDRSAADGGFSGPADVPAEPEEPRHEPIRCR